MSIGLVNRLIMFVVLALAQVLILNRVWLFDVATPLLYVFFAITFPRNTPRWEILLWCFLLGLVIDVFSNTPGLAAGTMTLVGFLQPYLLELFVPRDSVDNLEVSAATLGPANYGLLCVLLVLIYCLVFFGLEAFNFFDWQYWLLRASSSTVLILVMIMAIESIRSK